VRRAVALVALAFVACTGNQSTGDATRILRDSATAMAQLRTVSATLKLTKGTLSIQGFALANAKTAVRLPADSDTIYTVKEQDLSVGIQIVIVGGHVYEHLPFSPFREVSAAEAAQFPNMAKLFDATSGLPAIIPAGTDKKYVAGEQIDNRSVDHVSTTYSPDQVRSLLAELNSSGPVSANLWIGSDHLIRKAVLNGDFGDGGTQAAVEVDISNFNGTVSITSPTP
jgi:hypothetical protein